MPSSLPPGSLQTTHVQPNVKMGGNVPGWIQDDMRRHLPPSLGSQAVHSTIPTVSPNERPTTFQSSTLNHPVSIGIHQPTTQVLSPWGVVSAQPPVSPPHPTNVHYTPPPYVGQNSEKKKRRRVRKRPKAVESSSDPSSSSTCKCQKKRRHSGSSLGGSEFGVKSRHGSRSSSDFERRHRDANQHTPSFGPYNGPQFVPAMEGSSSNWGAVPPKELKWTRRRGSHDLFPDWKNSSHHTQKVVQKRRSCC